MTREADVIAVGRVSNIRETSSDPATLMVAGHSYSAREYAADFSVEQTLKGEIPANTTIDYLLGINGAPGRSPSLGTRMVFLKRQASNTYTFVDPEHPDLVAFPGDDNHEWASNDLERVEQELMHVMSSPDASDESKVQALQSFQYNSDLLFGYYFAGEKNAPGFQWYRQYLAALRNAARTARSDDTRWTFRLLSVRHKDTVVMREIAARLAAGNLEPDRRAQFVQAVADCKFFDLADNPLLLDLAHSKDAGLRAAGLQHLFGGPGRPDVTHILFESLDDSDLEVRYWAVYGLAHQTQDNAHMPPPHANIEEYRQHEAEYLSYWRAKRG